jgi:hypothetical protein
MKFKVLFCRSLQILCLKIIYLLKCAKKFSSKILTIFKKFAATKLSLLVILTKNKQAADIQLWFI